ncbi:hypothetical protein P4631_09095 [Halalkalibacterium halodurans]|uniref:YqaI family protein n=1 Tax=Halalkalibacterium halodurans TaxID=86665 RepID=UPI002E1B5E9E|nr:hypothetical protein [Halalkalibacterium halodurans]
MIGRTVFGQPVYEGDEVIVTPNGEYVFEDEWERYLKREGFRKTYAEREDEE